MNLLNLPDYDRLQGADEGPRAELTAKPLDAHTPGGHSMTTEQAWVREQEQRAAELQQARTFKAAIDNPVTPEQAAEQFKVSAADIRQAIGTVGFHLTSQPFCMGRTFTLTTDFGSRQFTWNAATGRLHDGGPDAPAVATGLETTEAAEREALRYARRQANALWKALVRETR